METKTLTQFGMRQLSDARAILGMYALPELLSPMPNHMRFVARPETSEKSKKAGHDARERRRLKVAARPRPDACECCGKRGKKLVLDHCHTRHVFRGWICSNCNTVLGMAGDEIPVLESCIRYLAKQG